MACEVLPLPFKPHRLGGLTVSHYENNYGGEVRRLHAIEVRLQGLGRATALVCDTVSLGCERLMAANSMLPSRSGQTISLATAGGRLLHLGLPGQWARPRPNCEGAAWMQGRSWVASRLAMPWAA